MAEREQDDPRDFVFQVQDDRVWVVTGHGRMTEGRAYGHNYPEDPKALCSLAPPKGTDFWLIRAWLDPIRFTSWGIEMFTCGGGGMVCGIGIPDDLDVQRGDIFMKCSV